MCQWAGPVLCCCGVSCGLRHGCCCAFTQKKALTLASIPCHNWETATHMHDMQLTGSKTAVD